MAEQEIAAQQLEFLYPQALQQTFVLSRQLHPHVISHLPPPRYLSMLKKFISSLVKFALNQQIQDAVILF
jgi:hypothetical protein